MPDNTRYPVGTQDGDTYASDLIDDGGVADGAKVERVKVGHGADGDYKDATTSDPLPVSVGASLPLPTGAATEATLSTLNGKVASAKTADFDTGGGTDTVQMVGLALPASGGAVAGGTSTNPVRTDPTGTTTQPISAASLPLPSGAAQEHTAADSPHAARLSDGSAFYKATTPADTQPVSAASLPLPSGAATEATLSSLNGKVVTAKTADFDTGGGTDTVQMMGIALPKSGGAAAGGTSSDPLRVDPTGTTAQPITDNAGSITVDAPTGTPVNVQIGDGTRQATVRDTGSSDSLNVAIVDASGNQITSFGGGTQYTEDVAAAADPVGTALNLIRKDTLAAVTSDDGDNVAARGTNKGELYVKHADSIPVTDNGGSLTVDGTVTVQDGGGAISVDDNGSSLTVDNAALSVTGGGVEASALRVTIANDSTGVLSVDDNGGALSVDDNGGSLTVDNAALSVTGGGVEASALRVTIANDSTGVLSVDDNGGSLTVDGTVTASNTAGTAANGAGVSGNPVQVGVEARTTQPTAVDDGDVVRPMADKCGRLVTSPHSPRDLTDDANITLSNTTETDLFAAGGSGVFLDLVSVVVSNGSSGILRVDFRDSATGTVRLSVWAAANGGGASIEFPVPKKQGTANNKWTAQLSGTPGSNDVRICAQAVRRN